jgi:hypothetical protein
MSKLTLNEIATPTTPASNKAVIYVDSTTNEVTAVKDTGATVSLETMTGGTFDGKLNKDTTLPSPVPTQVELFVLDRQSTNDGDILYISLQIGDASWDWFEVIRAPAL